MDKFNTLTGVAAPMDMINIDTDKIIPKLHLRTIKRTGLGKVLFEEMRFEPDGREKPDFILNKDPYRDAKIIVAGDNFHLNNVGTCWFFVSSSSQLNHA